VSTKTHLAALILDHKKVMVINIYKHVLGGSSANWIDKRIYENFSPIGSKITWEMCAVVGDM